MHIQYSILEYTVCPKKCYANGKDFYKKMKFAKIKKKLIHTLARELLLDYLLNTVNRKHLKLNTFIPINQLINIFRFGNLYFTKFITLLWIPM